MSVSTRIHPSLPIPRLIERAAEVTALDHKLEAALAEVQEAFLALEAAQARMSAAQKTLKSTAAEQRIAHDALWRYIEAG